VEQVKLGEDMGVMPLLLSRQLLLDAFIHQSLLGNENCYTIGSY